MQFWLVKQEPESYPWSRLVQDGRTQWTGVRNFQARNNLRAMRRKDRVLYYHSASGKEVVGVAEVAKPAYADPTAAEGDWVCVDLVPIKPLKSPVSLARIKADKALKDLPVLRQSRLSVAPVTREQFDRILELGGVGPRQPESAR